MPLLDKWEPMNPGMCPACGSTSLTILDDDDDVRIYQCDSCGHEWEEETE